MAALLPLQGVLEGMVGLRGRRLFMRCSIFEVGGSATGVLITDNCHETGR